MTHRLLSNGAVVFIPPKKAYLRAASTGWEVAAPWSKAPVWCARWSDALQVLDILFRMRDTKVSWRGL